MRMIAVIACLLATPVAALAQSATRPQILVLGTYHMASPGRDVHNMEVDDILSERRQREVAEVIEILRRFRPTKIAVEAPVGSRRLGERYAEYRAGRYALTRNEVDQIGLRLARELGLDTIYAVDEDGDFPFLRVRNYAIASGMRERFDAMQATVGDRVREQGEFLRTHTLLETLEYINADSTVAQAFGEEYGYVPFGEPHEYAGPDLMAAWFQRNIRIYRNVLALATPQDRILVVYGAGHLGWLQHSVRSDPSVELRTLADLLQ